VKAGALTASLLAFTAVVLAQPANAESVKVFAAAVVKEPLTAIATDYEKATCNKVTLIFDTAGSTEQRFRAAADAALLITASPLIRKAEMSGALKDGSITVLGATVAGVAVTRTGQAGCFNAGETQGCLLAARRIAVSDPSRGATVVTQFQQRQDANDRCFFREGRQGSRRRCRTAAAEI
jgi:ABC-type molybdate transport system substrate-binding protein